MLFDDRGYELSAYQISSKSVEWVVRKRVTNINPTNKISHLPIILVESTQS